MRRLVVATLAACVAILAGSAPASAAAHAACGGAKGAHHHHRGKGGKVKHFCRQKRARHSRCPRGGHHHHRVRGKRVHYCAARPKRSPAPAVTPPSPVTPAPASVLPPAPPVTPAPAPTQPAATRLQVTTREFTLTLSRPSLPPGPALVELLNRGEDPHDLHIGGVGAIPETAAGERATGRFDLPEGTYTVYCSLPGHEALGMSATLRVDRLLSVHAGP